MPHQHPLSDLDGPTDDELAAIEREGPLIEAEMDLVAAEARVLTAVPHPNDLDWQRLRRAERRVACEFLALLATEGTAALSRITNPTAHAA